MKAPAFLIAAVVCLGLFAVSRLPAQLAEPPAKKPAAPKWQHLALTHELSSDPRKKKLTEQIHKVEREGWELVDVESVDKDGTTVKSVFYFKRRQSSN